MSAEDLQALKENEEFLLNVKDEDFEDPDKVTEITKRLKDAQTTIHQKRHYREKVVELNEKLKTPPAPKPPETKAPEKKADEAPKGVDPVKALEFRQDHPELSKDVAKEILEGALAYGITPEEYLKKPMVQKYVQDQKTKEDVEDGSIAPGNRSGSEAEKKDWSSASQKDIEAERNRILQGQ